MSTIDRSPRPDDLRHPDPARVAERARLGLLGRLPQVLCLLDDVEHASPSAELRAGPGEHLAPDDGDTSMRSPGQRPSLDGRARRRGARRW